MRKPFYISFLLLIGTTIHAQNDTLWIGYNDEIVEKPLASYYKFVTAKKDHTFEVTQYTKENTLYSKGISTTKESPSTYQGRLQLYAQNGLPLTTTEYNNGLIVGPSITTLADGTVYTATYKDNEFFDGIEVYEFQDLYVAREANNGKLVTAQLFAEKPNKIRQIIYFENDAFTKEESYDNNGILIATCTYSNSEIAEGTKIEFYNKPYPIKSVSEHKNSTQIKKTTYYRTGEVKEIETYIDQLKKISHFDKTGKEIAVFTEKTDLVNYGTISDGVNIIYNTSLGKEDLQGYINTYKNGELVEIQEFNNEGVIKQITSYRESYYPTKTTNFDSNGNIESELIYDEYGSAIDGTEKQENLIRVYKNSKLVSEIQQYSNGAVFKKHDNFKTVYFDKKAQQIGEATFDPNSEYTYYSTPVNGVLLTLGESDLIEDSSTYKNGKLLTAITFANHKGKAVQIQKITYDSNEYKISDIKYYPTGKILSQQNYLNYELVQSSFFDEQGRLLGAFDHTQMHGTLYTFFDSGNEIKSISKYDKGLILYKKTFSRNDLLFLVDSKISLESEIDYYKEGLFYENGELVSKTVYKDGKPFQGKIIVRDEYASKVVSNYENGEKEGEELTYSAYFEELTTRDFYHLGQRVFTETYENNIISSRIPIEDDMYNGESIYFDDEGQELSRLIYKDNEPFEGKLFSSLGENSTQIHSYQNGYLIEQQNQVDGNVRFSKTLIDEENKSYQIKSFSETGKPIYSFKIKDEELDGELVFYGENGKIKNKAILKNGQLISGTISLELPNYDYDSNTYIVANRKGEKYTTKVYDAQDNSLMYESTTVVKDTKKTINPLAVSYPITQSSLYPTVNEYDHYYY